MRNVERAVVEKLEAIVSFLHTVKTHRNVMGIKNIQVSINGLNEKLKHVDEAFDWLLSDRRAIKIIKKSYFRASDALFGYLSLCFEMGLFDKLEKNISKLLRAFTGKDVQQLKNLGFKIEIPSNDGCFRFVAWKQYLDGVFMIVISKRDMIAFFASECDKDDLNVNSLVEEVVSGKPDLGRKMFVYAFTPPQKLGSMLRKIKREYGKFLKKRKKALKSFEKLVKKLRKIGYEAEFEEVESDDGKVVFKLKIKDLRTGALAAIDISKADLLSYPEFEWHIDKNVYDLVIEALHILEEAFSTSVDSWMKEELIKTITSDSVFPTVFLPSRVSWKTYLFYVKECLKLGFDVNGQEVLYNDDAFRRMVKEYHPAPYMLGKITKGEVDIFVFRKAVLDYLPEGYKSVYLIRAKDELQQEDLSLITCELHVKSHRSNIYNALVKRYYNRGMPKNLQEIFLKHFTYEADDLDCLNFLTIYGRICGDFNIYPKIIEPIIKVCLSKLLGLSGEFAVDVLRGYITVVLKDEKGKPAIFLRTRISDKSYEITALSVIGENFVKTASHPTKGMVVSTLNMYLPKERSEDIRFLKEFVKLSHEYCKKLVNLEKLVYKVMGKSFSILLHFSKMNYKIVFPSVYLSYYAGNWESHDTLETFRDVIENLDNHVTIVFSGKRYTLREFSEKFSKIVNSS